MYPDHFCAVLKKVSKNRPHPLAIIFVLCDNINISQREKARWKEKRFIKFFPTGKLHKAGHSRSGQ